MCLCFEEIFASKFESFLQIDTSKVTNFMP